jgi:hypothetical protein
MIPRGTTFEFEYLGEFKMEIKNKNILGHESGAHMGLIHEKKQSPKISCYCTFNTTIGGDPPQSLVRGKSSLFSVQLELLLTRKFSINTVQEEVHITTEQTEIYISNILEEIHITTVHLEIQH